MSFHTPKPNELSFITGTLPKGQIAHRPARSRFYYRVPGVLSERYNSGDEFMAQERAAAKERKGLRPCGLPAKEWPVCHQRCYLRPKCWAAQASDLRLSPDEYRIAAKQEVE